MSYVWPCRHCFPNLLWMFHCEWQRYAHYSVSNKRGNSAERNPFCRINKEENKKRIHSIVSFLALLRNVRWLLKVLALSWLRVFQNLSAWKSMGDCSERWAKVGETLRHFKASLGIFTWWNYLHTSTWKFLGEFYQLFSSFSLQLKSRSIHKTF